MREIVHLQAGQCGNQIGAKVSVGKSLFAKKEYRCLFFLPFPCSFGKSSQTSMA
jgi:hypothetical protein